MKMDIREMKELKKLAGFTLLGRVIGGLLFTQMLAVGPGAAAETAAKNDGPNVLFISIDDWRNDLGALGVDHVQTPHMDRFAGESVLFSQHYVQVPTCGASRASLLTGLRGPQTGLGNNATLLNQAAWGDRVLPRVFRQHGYQTLALGKITHYPGGLAGRGWANPPEELPNAWDRSWVPQNTPWVSPEAMMHGYAGGVPRDRGNSPAWEAHDGDDKSYPDGWIAEEAVEILNQLADSDQPWFFGVGFFKPHLPFAAPQKYFDLYDPDGIPAPIDTARHPSPSAWNRSGELMGNYGNGGKNPYTDEAYARTLRHAYAAATSYVDAQVGKVLDRVRELGLMDDLIIVIWSDHGFALGERNTWAKHNLYEAAVRSPLLIRFPGMGRPGSICRATVETVDLFPTLTELAGLPAPEGIYGTSLRPLLENPEAPSLKPAFSHWGGQEAVRDDRWRLIVQGSATNNTIRGLELFDFQGSVEGVRVDPGDNSEVVERLLKALVTQFD
jgi:iduronate 2-sulfatase